MNKTVPFHLSVECNMRNIFLKNTHAEYGGDTISTPFPRKVKIEHISGSIV